ncbi:MAG: VIT1/CCC1 transporter family protein, partial [Acidobacteriota bacterium]|nr:VIT1/CCC1 transporter family protein [Acidobacteriota bacterium]
MSDSGGSAAGRDEEVAKRLLTAWRGEVEARAVYGLIAARERDPRRAGILLDLAEAESVHRRRLEGRMRELGVPIPDPATVKISRWTRLQARVAPVDRLLAAREAAESEEVEGVYGQPTGDPQTDSLLIAIRDDESSHSQTVRTMIAGGEVVGGVSGAQAAGDGGGPAVAPVGADQVQARLDRILGREKWHSGSGGWISGAIYGANDGLAAVFGIVTGVSGATGASPFVLTAGLAGAVASALSMATGAFLAERSTMEVAAAWKDGCASWASRSP